MTSSTTPVTVVAGMAESTATTKNSVAPPPPPPRPPPSATTTTTIIRRRNNNRNNTNPHNHQYYARGRHSIEDFQDGKRFSAAENTSILHVGRSVGVAFRNGFLNPSKNNNGNKKNDTTTIGTGTSNSMNTVRHSVGLYLNYPLANSILDGSSKREIAFKLSGIKQMNHVRGTDGWFKSMFVLEVRIVVLLCFRKEGRRHPACYIITVLYSAGGTKVEEGKGSVAPIFLFLFLSHIFNLTYCIGVLYNNSNSIFNIQYSIF